MPLELQIIRASEFIRLGAQGRLDLAGSRDILRMLARACWLRGINQALLDLREVNPGPTPMLTSRDLEALVNAFCEMGFSNQLRLAVLYSSDPHRRARQFAFMTTLRGWNVKATENFEEALLWLSKGKKAEDSKEAGAQEIQIPIQVKGKPVAPPARTQLCVEAGREQQTRPPARSRTPSAASTKQTKRKKGTRVASREKEA